MILVMELKMFCIYEDQFYNIWYYAAARKS